MRVWHCMVRWDRRNLAMALHFIVVIVIISFVAIVGCLQIECLVIGSRNVMINIFETSIFLIINFKIKLAN